MKEPWPNPQRGTTAAQLHQLQIESEKHMPEKCQIIGCPDAACNGNGLCFRHQYAAARPSEAAQASIIAGEPSPALATQVGGDHYKRMKIQPMEFSMANGLDACQHTIIKYVCRFRAKNGIQDLEKAKHCIDMLIAFEKARNA